MTVWRTRSESVDEIGVARQLGVHGSSPQNASPAQRRSPRGFSTVFPAIHTPYYYDEVLK
jgi:hypothetical protein